MDMITLAMAKQAEPKVLDLTKFTTSIEPYTGYTLSDVVMTLFQMSLTSGNVATTLVSCDALKPQATTNKDTYIIQMNAMGYDMRMPATYMYSSLGVGQLSMSGLVVVPDVGVVNIQTSIVFYDNYNDRFNIYVKATPLA